MKMDPTEKTILTALADALDQPLLVLLSRRRTQPLSLQRHLACYFLRHEMRWTLRQIGEAFDRRPASVLYGVRNAQRAMQGYAAVRAGYRRLYGAVWGELVGWCTELGKAEQNDREKQYPLKIRGGTSSRHSISSYDDKPSPTQVEDH